jgi:hypothetical protein
MFCTIICGAVYASYDWVAGRLLGCALDGAELMK